MNAQPTTQRGQVLAVFAGALVLLLLISALVFDLGMAWMTHRQEQNAVDPAALAAAKYVPALTGPGVTGPMQAVACHYARQNGLFQAAATDDMSSTGCVPANDAGHAVLTVNYPPVGPSAGAFAGRLGFVQVGVTRQQGTFFLGILGQSTMTTSASAVAANTNGDSNSYTLIALDPGCTAGAAGQLGGNGGGTTSGKVVITPATNPATGQPYQGGYVQVNSTCGGVPNPPQTTTCLSNGTGALQVAGGSGIQAPAIFVTGQCANSGTITTNAGSGFVTQGAIQVGDPLAELKPPSASGTGQKCLPTDPLPTDSTTAGGCHFTKAGTYSMPPGIYYGGWQIGNSVTLQLQSGIYIMAGGGIKLTGTGSITSVLGTSGAAPVMIFSTDDPIYGPQCLAGASGLPGQACQGGIDLVANGSLDLVGMASGPYKGLLVWQDGKASCNTPSGACNVSLGGQSTLSISGTIYAPKVQVTLNGGGSVSSPAMTAIQIISWWWQITGGSNLNMPYDPSQLYHLEQRGLVH